MSNDVCWQCGKGPGAIVDGVCENCGNVVDDVDQADQDDVERAIVAMEASNE